MQVYGCYCKMFRGLTFLGHSVVNNNQLYASLQLGKLLQLTIVRNRPRRCVRYRLSRKRPVLTDRVPTYVYFGKKWCILEKRLLNQDSAWGSGSSVLDGGPSHMLFGNILLGRMGWRNRPIGLTALQKPLNLSLIHISEPTRPY